MATAPASENAFTVQGFDELRGLDEQIFSAICPVTEAPPQPINGGFSSWSEWDSCTATCGIGIKTRTRECDNPPPQFGGLDCVGDPEEFVECIERPCPIDGGFSQWTEWGQCSRTCGLGTMTRQRFCNSPAPQYGGRECEGSTEETTECQIRPCPIDGGYSQWTEWSQCSATCGLGTITRRRFCNSPAPQHGGRDCVGSDAETTECQIEPCQVPVTLPPPVTECGLAKVDLVFVLDSSTSVGQDNYDKMLQFLKDFLKNADIDSGSIRVGVVSYSTGVNVEFQMNDYTTQADMFNAIDNIPYRYGSTNTADGLLTMHDQMFTAANGDRPNVPNIAIVITDGVSNINARRTIPEAEAARNKGIHVYVIGIGLTDTTEIFAMASVPASENAFTVQGFDELRGLDEQIFSAICPVPATLPPQECGLARVDLVFVLDSSTSVGQDNFAKMLTFLKDFLQNADINSGSIRVGVVTYSTDFTIQFQLNEYTSQDGVFEAIDNIPYIYGSTNTADGLLTMHETMFSIGNGDRPDVPNIAIVVTDGVSNINARRTIPEAEAAKAKGIHIYVIGIGLTDTTEVNAIATAPAAENAFNVQDFDELKGLEKTIFSSICPGTEPTPIDGGFSEWGPYGPCSVTCGLGYHTRSRTCTNPAPQYGGRDCQGDYQERQQCETVPCPIDGRYSEWTQWTACTASCDGGITTRTRDCNNPPPQFGGRQCDGVDSEVKVCGMDPCPIDGGFSEWTLWGPCSVTCGPGTMRRRRRCNNPRPQHGGRGCVGNRREETTCNLGACPTAAPECGLARVDLVIILDSSTSVGQDNYNKMLKFVKDLLSNADIDSGSVRVGLVSYSTDVTIHFQLNEYSTQADVFSAIDAIPYIYGSTNTADGLQRMHDVMFTAGNGDRADVPNIAIIITDGISNINARRTIPEAETAKSKNIHIYSIGIGLADTTEVDAIATAPSSENSFVVQDFDELTGLDEKIFQSICPVSTPAPTTLPTPRECDQAQIDLVIIIDSSTSVGGDNFAKTLNFCKDFLDNADIDSGNVRVGVVTYSTDVEVHFDLNSYSTKADVFTAIDNIPYIYGSTNTAGGLNTMRTKMFTAGKGDRPGVRNIAMIVTDGVSNINARDTIPEALEARKEGIHIYAVGIGLTDTRELDGMASEPVEENRFIVADFDELKGLDKQVFSALCPGDTPEPTTPAPPTPPPTGYDLVIILDSSVSQRIYQWMLDFARDLTQQLNIDGGDFRVGVLRYSTDSDIQFQLRDHTNQRALRRAISRIQYRPGQTNTAKAFETVRTQMFRPRQGDRDYARNYILLLTGNEESLDTNEIWREAERAEDDGIGIFVVGINTDDTREINETSTHPLSQYRFLVRRRSDLLEIPGQLDYRIRSMPERPPREWPRRRPRIQPTTTPAPTTLAPTPPPHGYDLVIVLDSSVTPEIYQWMLNFVKRLSSQLSVDDGEFRVGVMRYSTYADIQFNLDDHQRQSALGPAIERIQYRPGETNTAKALETVRTRMFRRNQGDRDYARNFILLLTGNEQSLNTNDAWAAAERAEDDGIGIYVIGINIGDTNEIDEVASHPLSEYRFLVRRESDLQEIPGQMDFRLNRMPEQPPREWPRRRPRITTPAPTRRPLPRPEKCTSVGDIVFILDSSGSVGRNNFYNVLNFTYNTVEELDIDTGHYRIGVITFSDNARLEFGLDRYNNKRDIERALTRVRYVYGSTHTAAALRMARTDVFRPNGDRPEVPNVIVIVTDGESNINHRETIPEAMRLKRDGVSIITVAIGFTSRSDELHGLTSPPISENLIRVENFDALEQLRDKLVAPLCTDTDICSTDNPCRNGGRCIDGLRSYTCVCTEGYYGENCDKTCGDPADVAFVLDSSNTVGPETFRRMKNFAEHLVTELNIEACNIRIGFMKYSSRAMIQFNIGTYTDTDTINRVIDSTSYTRGRANMADAFYTLRTRMFHGNGDRNNVRNIAYILTDGSVDVNADNTMREAELAIQSGIYIVPIGVSIRNRDEVESIALSQGTNTIEIDSESTLMTMSDEVLRPIFDLTDHCSASPCKHGGTCSSNGNGFTCSCVPGYTGDRCQRRCNAEGDVVFAVDTSRYVTRKELRRVKRFIRSLVKRMSFRRRGFRVGIVEFNSNSKVSLTFQAGRKKKAVLASVSGIRSKGGDPNPKEALRKAAIRLFDVDDRRSSPNYLILITKSMNDELNVIRQANKLKVAGTKVIGVGIGLTGSEQEFLSSAVSSPVPNYMHLVNDVRGLNDVADNIMSMLCDERNMCESNPCGTRGECVPTAGSYYCQCRRGYAGKNCEKACNAKADVAFLLDSSGSVGQRNFEKVKAFVSKMVDDMTIGYDATRVGLVSFSDVARMGFYMDEYMTKDAVQTAISAVNYEYGNTNTASGLKLVRNHIFDRKRGDRPEAQNFLIVVTDGLSNINPENTIKEADRAKKEGVHVIAIGIGSFDAFEINAMASPPASKNVLRIDDFNRLLNISDKLVSATCRDPSVCDENPCLNGGSCTPLINGFKCTCARGYRGQYCEAQCQTKKDIVFVLDSSSSVGESNFKQVLNFVKALIEELSGAGTNNKFGLVTYSTEPSLIFSLGRYQDVGTVSNAVATARYTPGSTNTAGGLRTALEIFTNNYGNRRDAEDVIILITDGESNVQAYNTIPTADEIKNNHIKVVSIGIKIQNNEEITRIASSPDDVFQVGAFESLSEVKADILDTSCKENGA